MNKTTRKLISVTLMLVMIFATSFSVPAASAPLAPQIKNIIFMIPDGGAMAPFYLADAVKRDGGFDKAKYPNALLTRFWDKWWILHIFGEYTVLDSPPNNPTDQDSDWIVLNGTGDTSNCEAYLKSAYDEETGQWGAFESDQYSPYTDYLSNVKWSSVDLHAYDGSLYLAASTPVPVYE